MKKGIHTKADTNTNTDTETHTDTDTDTKKWIVPHSDRLAWLSSATLKIFISGVSSRILMP